MNQSNKLTGALRLTAVAMALCGFSGMAAAQTTDKDSRKIPPTLEQLSNMQVKAISEVEQKMADEYNLRKRAMREAAQSYGVRSGMLRRMYELQVALENPALKLDQQFNFAPLMLTDFQPGEKADLRSRIVQPPIIVEMGRTVDKINDKLIRSRDGVVNLHQNAKFVTTVPTWRDYLVRKLFETEANLPHASLLPRTPEEKSNWDEWVKESFSKGVEQADSMLKIDMARLERDYLGMVRYHNFLDQKKVSLPYVSTTNNGVTGSGENLNYNDVTLQITVMPEFQVDSSKWQATGTNK